MEKENQAMEITLTEEQLEKYVNRDLEIFSSEHLIIQTLDTGVNKRIKELRLENGLTQKELAEILGVSQKEYWRYEQDGYSLNIAKLAWIAIFYNVSLDWLSGFYQIKKPFFDEEHKLYIRGYVLEELKAAKARGEKYIPRD